MNRIIETARETHLRMCLAYEQIECQLDGKNGNATPAESAEFCEVMLALKRLGEICVEAIKTHLDGEEA